MAKVFGFNEDAYRRVQQAVRQVLGTPKKGSQRRRQVPVIGGSGQTTILQSRGGPFTILEYDHTTGAVIQQFDRGRPRTAVTCIDHDGLVSSDGFLYVRGQGAFLAQGLTTEPTGAVVKWDPDESDALASRVWDSQGGVLSTTFTPNGTGRIVSPVLAEGDDGHIWAWGPGDPDIGVSAYSVSKYDSADGSLMAEWTINSSLGSAGATPVSGGRLIHFSSANTRLIDSDGTLLQTVAMTLVDWVDAGSSILVVVGSQVRRYAKSDLSLLDDSDTVFSAVQTVATDGTTVFVRANDGSVNGYHGLDAGDLTSIQWSQAATLTTSNQLLYHDGRLYDRAFTSASTTRLYKLNPADGTEIWEWPTGMLGNTVQKLAVGSGFVVINPGSTANVVCLNDSDGSQRWYDTLNPVRFHVSADDRVFGFFPRTNP